jgi:hypothetical protein
LKHLAENWGKRHGLSSYISRGALTAAAVALGLAVRRYGPLFAMKRHVTIGVNLRDLKRINTAMPQKPNEHQQ